MADFLLETSCKKEFTTKTIMDMTTGNYQIIFTHLASMILGELKEAHKGSSFPEVIVTTMNTLNYPFTLSKSSFSNFSLTSWPIALGVLDYLYNLAKMESSVEVVDDFDDDDKEHLCQDSYKQLMQDDTEAIENAAQDYESFALQDENRLEEEIERQTEHYQKQLSFYQQTTNEKVEVDRARQEKLLGFEKIKNFLDYEIKQSRTLDDEVEKQQKKHHQLLDEISSLESEIESLNAKIGDKDTAVDLKNKLEKIKEELGRFEVDRVHYEQMKNDLDVAYTKLKDKIDDQIQTYNQ